MKVTVKYEGKYQEVNIEKGSRIVDVLRQLNIDPDFVSPRIGPDFYNLDETVRPGDTITLEEKQISVTIRLGDNAKTYQTKMGTTLGQLLEKQRISLEDKDLVPLVDDEQITEEEVLEDGTEIVLEPSEITVELVIDKVDLSTLQQNDEIVKKSVGLSRESTIEDLMRLLKVQDSDCLDFDINEEEVDINTDDTALRHGDIVTISLKTVQIEVDVLGETQFVEVPVNSKYSDLAKAAGITDERKQVVVAYTEYGELDSEEIDQDSLIEAEDYQERVAILPATKKVKVISRLEDQDQVSELSVPWNMNLADVINEAGITDDSDDLTVTVNQEITEEDVDFSDIETDEGDVILVEPKKFRLTVEVSGQSKEVNFSESSSPADLIKAAGLNPDDFVVRDEDHNILEDDYEFTEDDADREDFEIIPKMTEVTIVVFKREEKKVSVKRGSTIREAFAVAQLDIDEYSGGLSITDETSDDEYADEDTEILSDNTVVEAKQEEE